MGKKPAARQPSPMWVTTADLPTSAGHPFFERLNQVLEEAGFDAFVEGLCAVFYASRLGRPSLRPGRYFRLLFIGYFEGLSSEVFVYRVEARKSAKWCAGLVRMCRYVQYGSRGRQTGRFEGARARG